MEVQRQADVVVIGGGLTGIMSALRLTRAGSSVILLDNTLPQADGRIGGFARFSGAKFSLPPAGMGLLPVAGSAERLSTTIDSVLRELGLERSMASGSVDLPGREAIGLRKYDSIVLSPSQVADLLDGLGARVAAEAELIHGRATGLERSNGSWRIQVEALGQQVRILTDAVFYGAGRLSDDLLRRAGAETRDGKGLDIGVRLEFESKDALSVLRSFGPDAKVLHDGCRTFCLNSPGHIYRYPYGNLSIPGGVVASPEVETANVGLLLRLPDKRKALDLILRRAQGLEAALLDESKCLSAKGKLILPPVLIQVFGEASCRKLEEFANHLNSEGLLDLAAQHYVHMPLLDWHWNTFALPASHLTSLDNVYALGDSAGHARGLLQACISGWLAAEEYLC